MIWFENLMFYGFQDNSYDPDDEDTNLIPRMAEKALLPKLTGYFNCLFIFFGSSASRLTEIQIVIFKLNCM